MRGFFGFVSTTIRAFFKDECNLKAALLTFYTLVSIVPFFAFTLGIAKSFGFAEFLKKEILTTFKEQKDLLTAVMEFAIALIGNIQSGVIAGLGLLFLFVSIFGLLENLEQSLNSIWRITKPRPFFRRAVDYLAIIIICPILFVVSSGMTLFISAQVTDIFPNYPVLREISPFIIALIKFAPYLLGWTLFTFLYLFVPNTRPRFWPRLFSGLIAGTLFQLWQQAYFEFQTTITSYNAVYGSFAALPLFLIWMQVNYMIFLYGAEIASHIENEMGPASSKDHVIVGPKVLAFYILQHMAQRFINGEAPQTRTALAKELGIPLYKMKEMLHILEERGMIGEIYHQHRRSEAYQLLMNPELLTMSRISLLIDEHFENSTPVKLSPSLQYTSACYQTLLDQVESSSANRHLNSPKSTNT